MNLVSLPEKEAAKFAACAYAVVWVLTEFRNWTEFEADETM